MLWTISLDFFFLNNNFVLTAHTNLCSRGSTAPGGQTPRCFTVSDHGSGWDRFTSSITKCHGLRCEHRAAWRVTVDARRLNWSVGDEFLNFALLSLLFDFCVFVCVWRLGWTTVTLLKWQQWEKRPKRSKSRTWMCSVDPESCLTGFHLRLSCLTRWASRLWTTQSHRRRSRCPDSEVAAGIKWWKMQRRSGFSTEYRVWYLEMILRQTVRSNVFF